MQLYGGSTNNLVQPRTMGCGPYTSSSRENDQEYIGYITNWIYQHMMWWANKCIQQIEAMVLAQKDHGSSLQLIINRHDAGLVSSRETEFWIHARSMLKSKPDLHSFVVHFSLKHSDSSLDKQYVSSCFYGMGLFWNALPIARCWTENSRGPSEKKVDDL